ncbi:hypothetical protein N9N13_07380 [Opitutales bacterium]|nr:hypothetical protein [Opitutales bacterium]
MKIILSISTALFFLASSFLIMAEDNPKAEEKSYSEKLKEVYEKGLKGAKEKYAETVGDGKELTGKSKEWVLKDIENIGDWEYKVESYDPDKTKDLEKKLNELGKERWECFWVESSKKEKVFYFKRTKMSYMSKIPTGAILRIMADFQNN